MQPFETRVNPDLLLEFFLSFARFEYALKATGLFVRHPDNAVRPPAAEPDWDRFAVSLRQSFDPNRHHELAQACRYLSKSPPNRQVIINGAPAWETPVREPTLPEIDFVLRMVRSVRNNLFHGGKHGMDVHETTERTEALLRSCLAVLTECLALAPEQRQAYNDAMI